MCAVFKLAAGWRGGCAKERKGRKRETLLLLSCPFAVCSSLHPGCVYPGCLFSVLPVISSYPWLTRPRYPAGQLLEFRASCWHGWGVTGKHPLYTSTSKTEALSILIVVVLIFFSFCTISPESAGLRSAFAFQGQLLEIRALMLERLLQCSRRFPVALICTLNFC